MPLFDLWISLSKSRAWEMKVSNCMQSEGLSKAAMNEESLVMMIALKLPLSLATSWMCLTSRGLMTSSGELTRFSEDEEGVGGDPF